MDEVFVGQLIRAPNGSIGEVTQLSTVVPGYYHVRIVTAKVGTYHRKGDNLVWRPKP